MTEINKAKKATFTLGDIELDCYQKPDGKYFLSMDQIAESISCDHRRLAQFRELKLAQTLYPEGFEIAGKCGVEGSSANVKMISLTDCPKYWMLAGIQTNNESALLLVAACATETLERRADRAFDVVVPEPVRDARIAQRLAPKCTVSHR